MELTKERIYILVAGGVLLLFAAVYRFAPDASFLSDGSEMDVLTRRVLKYEKFIRSSGDQQAKRVALERHLSSVETGLLAGSTHTLAAVDIQNVIQTIAEYSRVDVKTIRVIEHKIDPQMPYRPVDVSVTIHSSIRQLKEFLFRVENATKLLKVLSLNSRVRNLRDTEEIVTVVTIQGLKMNNDKAAKG